MLKITAIIIWVVLMLLALTGSSPWNISALVVTTTNSQYKADKIENNSFIREFCPALAELPLILGRPAPCTQNYSLFGN